MKIKVFLLSVSPSFMEVVNVFIFSCSCKSGSVRPPDLTLQRHHFLRHHCIIDLIHARFFLCHFNQCDFSGQIKVLV